MNHDGPEPEKPSPERAGQDAAFRRSMIGVQTRCRQLATSITAHDFEGVENASRDAVTMWLVGRAACRRLLERIRASSPLAESARELLEANYIALLELFAQATKTIAVPRMRVVLQDLRATLVAAMSQPLVGTAARAAAASSRGPR